MKKNEMIDQYIAASEQNYADEYVRAANRLKRLHQNQKEYDYEIQDMLEEKEVFAACIIDTYLRAHGYHINPETGCWEREDHERYAL